MDESTLTDSIAPVVIAGGGLVGALTALLIARQNPHWTITVLEPQAEGPAQDKRTIALSAATVALLQREGIWPSMAAHACAIEHIHVSDRGHLGMTRLHAEQERVPALGQVIAASTLNRKLYEACLAQANIDWQAGAWFESAVRHVDTIDVVFKQQDEERSITAKLLVGADGSRSQVRQQAGIEMQQTDYQQVGIIATLDLKDDLEGWAYERFTETGPIALLPINQYQASLVWSLTPAQAQQMMDTSDADFLAACQAAFGYRAGRFLKVENRVQYPLQLHLAEQNICQRTVLIGNASHTLHPIAGQGFNLGVRDAIALSEALRDCDDPGRYQVLNGYDRDRRDDYQQIIGLTDVLVRCFSSEATPLVVGRNLSLAALDWFAPARARFARLTMGFRD